jgi:hypothetical protein
MAWGWAAASLAFVGSRSGGSTAGAASICGEGAGTASAWASSPSTRSTTPQRSIRARTCSAFSMLLSLRSVAGRCPNISSMRDASVRNKPANAAMACSFRAPGARPTMTIRYDEAIRSCFCVDWVAFALGCFAASVLRVGRARRRSSKTLGQLGSKRVASELPPNRDWKEDSKQWLAIGGRANENPLLTPAAGPERGSVTGFSGEY